jgi:hypothetical protein
MIGTRTPVDRAFRVIVLGGIALAAVPASACGGQTASSSDAGSGADAADSGFPQEGPAYVDSSFPMETAQFMDTGIVEPDAFPMEGPAMLVDSGVADSGAAFDGFPQETAQAGDP